MPRLSTKKLLEMQDPMWPFNQFLTKECKGKYRLTSRIETETGGAGFIYFGTDDSEGRISWSVQDGVVGKGAGWGFPTREQVVEMLCLVVLYARGKGWKVDLES